MALQKIVDSMRDVTVVDATKLSGNLPAISGTNLTNLDATDLVGAVPTASLSNVDLVEGTKGADIASAGTITIGTDGGYFDITGTTGITVMTVAAGRVFTLQFDGVVTLTHSANLYLSGAANFTTEANDHMTFISVAANSVRQIGTGLKDGGSPSGLASFTGLFTMDQATATGTQAVTGVGFQPTTIFLWGNQNVSTTFETSWGMDDGSNGKAIATWQPSGAGVFSSVGASLGCYQSGSNYMYGAINSFDANGFTIGFKKVGSPTGTFIVAYLALK